MEEVEVDEQGLDLVKVFSAVTKDLKKNQASLNASDADNHNHGDNMVNTFKVITSAVKKTKDESLADQLAYAAQMLTKKGVGGTSQQYAQNLQTASRAFQGKSGLDLSTILSLVMMLLGGGQGAPQQQSSGGGNLLGGLLDMFLGGGQQQAPQMQQPKPNTDSGPSMDWGQLIGLGAQLLGSQGGSSAPQQQASAGGGDVLGQLVQGFLTNSPMSEQPRQSESGQIVANSILNLLGGLQ